MQEIRLEKAKNKDAIFIAEVCEETRKIYDPLVPGLFTRQAAIFREKGIPSGYDFYTIYDRYIKVGFTGVIHVTEEVTYLAMFYLKKRFYRLGIGSTALKELERIVRKSGTKTIVLLAHERAIWARKFYNKHDYIISKETAKTYKDGIIKSYKFSHTVIYEKEL